MGVDHRRGDKCAGCIPIRPAEKQNLKSQAALDGINARIAELAAQQELSRGQWQAAQVSGAAGQLKSRQRAALAANGLDLGVGSAAELQASTDFMKEADVQQTLSNALRSAWGYRLAGTNYANRATMASGAAGAINPGMSAAGTLLTNAGQVSNGWYAIRDAMGANDIDIANRVGAAGGDAIDTLGRLRNWFE